MATHQNSSGSEGSSFREFVHTEVFGSVLLLGATLFALIWANSPWHASYVDLWHYTLTLGTPHVNLTESLHAWVNDGLMAIFFLVVGLEIKREMTVGELSTPSAAVLPVTAAIGGAVLPAAIYLALNFGHAGQDGWGIPMATDIAFALGVLALLGSRIPVGLKVFLSALAIVDDLLAVVVIAVAYSTGLNWSALAMAGGILLLLFGCNRLGIRALWIYGVLGIGLWAAVYESGVHATIAGVLLAFCIPGGTRISGPEFAENVQKRLDLFSREDAGSVLVDQQQQEALADLERLVEHAGSPSLRLEHRLHPLVSFAIIPLFALANAGIHFQGSISSQIGNRAALGVLLGLVVGKFVGVTLGARIPIWLGKATWPDGMSAASLSALSLVAGIGFTMSIFVSDLAFPDDAQENLHRSAQIGILAASVIAGIAGYFALRRLFPKPISEVS